MLYIEFLDNTPGAEFPKDVEWRSDDYFSCNDVSNYICTDFAKDAIRDIDKSTVVGPNLIISDVLGPIPPEYLSGGVRTLLCMKYMPEVRCHMARMGENVYPWVFKAAEDTNIHVVTDYPRVPTDTEFTCMVENTGEVAHNAKELWGIHERLRNEGKI